MDRELTVESTQQILKGTGSLWAPRVGAGTQAFLDRQPHLLAEERERLLTEAVDILSTCQPPGARGRRTVLAVGRVQSGKTLSFETVTALARDNGFGLVIIIAGISKYLERQTRRRLERDLGFGDERFAAFDHWLLTSSALLLQGTDLGLTIALDAWGMWTAGHEQPPTAVIVTLKHHAHIAAVARALPRDFDVPTLVVDDEADQASLNVRARQPEKPPTTTYRELAVLRGRLASHTYVQYTATPQANFLLAATDTLAPDAVRLVTPGHGYVGNEDFFGQVADGHHVKMVPDDEAEVFTPGTTLTELPHSLAAAIDDFVIAAALGRYYARREGIGRVPPQASMLVHPARLVAEHTKALRWVRARLLLLRSLDDELLAAELQKALDGQRQTSRSESCPASALELISDIRSTLAQLDVLVLNRSDEGYVGEDGGDIPWGMKYAWIVIGGQMVDRGLTIPGLMSSYIPRSPGANIDTVQQRARWLGYKRPYLDRCRLWMTDDSAEFFTDYTEHELHMHAEVASIVEEGISLKEWRRRFLLDPRWQPTRTGVISRSLQRRLLESWEVFRSLGDGRPPSRAHRESEEELESYIRSIATSGVSHDHGHTWCDCTLGEALEIVDQYPVLDPEASEETKVLLLAHIARRIDVSGHSADLARIYLMNDLSVRSRVAEVDGYPVELRTLLQGRNRNYPGDRAIVRRGQSVPALTLQLHRVMPTTASRSGDPLWSRDTTTLVLAAHVPVGSDPGWVIERQ